MTWKKGPWPDWDSPGAAQGSEVRAVARLSRDSRHRRSGSIHLPSSNRFAQAVIDDRSRPACQLVNA